ncbi:MAG TPA: hypothetical protein VFK85_12645 [Anaeromyxobacteraceae bacterium]|nr:hypothetical protein [Anaeromyxobacteraceae bacterium]
MDLRYEDEVAVLRVRGTVDPACVHAVRERIGELPERSACVVVDLGDARDVQHVALATLAEDAAHRVTPRVVLKGLCEQHVRMLRCLGIDVETRLSRPGRLLAQADA